MTIPVGIDLGTSYSCVSAVVDGQPQVLPDDEGRRVQPSVVAFGYDGAPVVAGAPVGSGGAAATCWRRRRSSAHR